jgi:hypothetical protein
MTGGGIGWAFLPADGEPVAQRGWRCERWAASAWSPYHGRGTSHPPALGKSQGIKGTPLEPRQRGFAPLHSSFSRQRVPWEDGGGQDAHPTLSLIYGLRDESRSLSRGGRWGRWAASAWSPYHGRGASHPPALGKSRGIKGTPLEPRQRGFAPLHSSFTSLLPVGGFGFSGERDSEDGRTGRAKALPYIW